MTNMTIRDCYFNRCDAKAIMPNAKMAKDSGTNANGTASLIKKIPIITIDIF